MNKYTEILNSNTGIMVNNKQQLLELFNNIDEDLNITLTTKYVCELLFLTNDKVVIVLESATGKHSGASDIVSLCGHYIPEFVNMGNCIIEYEDIGNKYEDAV